MVVARGTKAVISSGLFPKVDIPDWRYGLGVFAAAMLFVWHPFSGGARVPTLVLFLLGMAFWATSWRQLHSDPIQRRWMLIVVCLGVPALLSLPTSYSSEHTLMRVVMILVMYVVGSGLIEVLRQPGVLRLVQTVVAIMLAIWLLDGVVQLVFGIDLLGIRQTGGGRVVGMYGNHLYLPWVLVLVLPLLLWMLLPDHPYKALLALLVGGVVIIGTGVRSALLAWLVVAAACLIHIQVPRKWLVITGLLAGLSLTIALSPIAEKKLEATSLGSLTFEQVNKLSNGRLFLWETGWHMFRDKPLTGVGADAYRSAYGEYASRDRDPFRPDGETGVQNAHQLYLSVAAETGLVGLLGILTVWGLLLRWYFMLKEEVRAKARPFAVGLLAVAFPVNSQPLIYKTWWAPLLVFFVSGILVAMASPTDNPGSKAVGKSARE